MDYGRLRAAALSHGEDEEAVTVDTRALIDKVLARYSGEWTTLRELIQNAADAQANTVKIKWETHPSTQVALPATTDSSELLKHVIQHHTLRRLVVSNNGLPFAKTDWARLKRIAEGNPDETKIGAFGVGFYSVFADCEEPFVSSGSEALAFYWKGNSLFTRKLQLSEEQSTPDTVFVLDYRSTTTPVPNLLSVSQFLGTSLTFVALENIEFWIDDYKILSLHKKTSPSSEVALSKDIDTLTKDRLMRIQRVDQASVQIDASSMSAIGWKPHVAVAKSTEEYGSGHNDMSSLRSFFSRFTTSSSAQLKNKAAKEEQAAQEVIAEDITARSNSSIFLRVTTAELKTTVPASFSAELERATKKPPPKIAKLAILTSSYDETKASESSSNAGPLSRATDVFSSVLPSKKPGGRIFIGFPTGQTTGAGMHISAPSVIPTVEREAIDLNARYVKTWNIDMLRAAGIMTRLAFTHEMSMLQQKIRRSLSPATAISSKEAEKYLPEAMHVLKSFTFTDSTPSGHVGQIIEEAFWTCYRKASIEIYSTRGVKHTEQVRIGSDELSKFVGGIPIVPPELRDIGFVKKVTDFGLLERISVQDVQQELSKAPLSKDQLVAFLSWATSQASLKELNPANRDSLLDAAIATVGEEQGGIITLGSIKNFVVQNKITPGLPIPPTTIPFEFTSKLSAGALRELGWEPLEIVPWLRFLLESVYSLPEDKVLTKSPKFAIQVLTVLSKGWDNLSESSKGTVVSLLQSNTVMPTKFGMKKPTDSYFPHVKLFDDLPTVQGTSALKDKFMSAIGVRKTVDLDVIFDRLLSPDSKAGSEGARWSHVELIKYLASVRADIPNKDLQKLKNSRICPAEAGPPGQESSNGTTQLYKVAELFEPKRELRALELRILQWPTGFGGFRLSSAEGKFLATLGLRPYPSVPELVNMMSSSSETLRKNALEYFISSHVANGYGDFTIRESTQSFLPVEGDPKLLVSPKGCYSNPAAAILGYKILRKDLHGHANKFGVLTDPPIMDCMSRLLDNPPRDSVAAIPVFEYFATRQADLYQGAVWKIQDAPIVPVTRKLSSSSLSEKRSSAAISHISPRNTFIGSSSAYGEIFDFVDFGYQANAFLLSCGAKHEPTKLQIAELVAMEPARMLGVFRSTDKYLNLLRSLAEDYSTLRRDKDLWKRMKASPFLLAFNEISPPKDDKEKLLDLDDDVAPKRQYHLAKAADVVILDDYIGFRLFKDRLMCAPEEDVLEAFYTALGSQSLGSLMSETLKIGSRNPRQDGALWLQKHVLERSKIFIHEYSRYTRDPLKHDAKWLEKNLSIEVVQSLALRRTLKSTGQSHTEERSAASAKTASGYVLYVASRSSRPDMYQVGQAVCQLILNRPSQQAYTFFEPFLKLDLLDLRARGYNVDRILRVKAAEARIAEEERRKALAAEEERAKNQKQQFEQQFFEQNAQTIAATARAAPPSTPLKQQERMPGSFDTPDFPRIGEAPKSAETAMETRTRRRSSGGGGGGGFLSNLSKRFGFGDDDDEDDAVSTQQGQQKRPSAAPANKHTGDSGRVTSPSIIQQNLINAVKGSRAHGSRDLTSTPQTTEVAEQHTYCDTTSAHDIKHVAEASNGMRVYVAKTLSADLSQLLSQNHRHINTFAALLRDAGDVYAMKPAALHIFYDEKGSCMAFNSGGSIFCNLRFYIQLHGGDDGKKRAEAAVYWWVVLAHELAHNIVKVHSADHEYYTESFVQQYFAKMMARVAVMGSGESDASGSGSGSGTPRHKTQAQVQQPPPLFKNISLT